jgi:hypothetical protein
LKAGDIRPPPDALDKYIKEAEDKKNKETMEDIQDNIDNLNLETKALEIKNALVKRNWENKHNHIITQTRSFVRQDPLTGAYHTVDPSTVNIQ